MNEAAELFSGSFFRGDINENSFCRSARLQ